MESLKGSLPEFNVYVIAKERHSDGGGHLHATIKLNNPRRTRISNQILSKLFDVKGHHCDVEFLKSAKDWEKAVLYCCKDGDYISDGLDIKALKERSTHNSHKKIYTCKEILETPISDLVDKDMISANAFSSILRAQSQWKLLSTPNVDLANTRGMWFYGPAGSGKSMTARCMGIQEGGYFLKPQSKWWDGYQGEPVVIIDDLDTTALNHYLKIWGDRYAFSGETKGGTLPIMCRKIIITSNYSIEELLRKESKDGDVDIELCHALKRRYKERFFDHVWTDNEIEQFNMQQEDQIAMLLREERNLTTQDGICEEPPNKKFPDDVPTPVMDVQTLVRVPQAEEEEAPQGEDSYSLVLEGHTALNLFNDTWVSGYHE